MKVKKLHPDAVIPKYAKPGDSGFDLTAVEDTIICPGETVKIRTGLAFEIPSGFEMQIRPRSGVTSGTKLRVQLGTIDAGYRGQVGIIVDNIAQAEYHEGDLVYDEGLIGIDGTMAVAGWYPDGSYIIRKGDRIAQGVLTVVAQTTFEEADELDETERGAGGFGHTGY